MTPEERYAAKIAKKLVAVISKIEDPDVIFTAPDQFADAIRMEASRYSPEVKKIVEHFLKYYDE